MNFLASFLRTSSMWLAVVVVLTAVLVLSGCDKGLAPLTGEPSGISGVIYFKNWPPPDSVKELRLLAFTTYPTDSTSIIMALIQGTVVVHPPIGTSGFRKFVDSLHYSITTEGTTLTVRKYDYVVLALRYGNNFFTDWRPAGVYAVSPDSHTPAPVRVLLHKVTPGIDIYVDFHNMPPRPWR